MSYQAHGSPTNQNQGRGPQPGSKKGMSPRNPYVNKGGPHNQQQPVGNGNYYHQDDYEMQQAYPPQPAYPPQQGYFQQQPPPYGNQQPQQSHGVDPYTHKEQGSCMACLTKTATGLEIGRRICSFMILVVVLILVALSFNILDNMEISDMVASALNQYGFGNKP